MSRNSTNPFYWGLLRGLGHTASKRTSDYIGGKVISPKSKFRKRIEKFDLGGEFTSARKKLTILIEMFHEEYIINKNDLPLFQVGTYLVNDIRFIDNKIILFQGMITNPETQTLIYESIVHLWSNIKNQLINE